MLAATLIAIFLIPVTFYVVDYISHRFSRKHPRTGAATAPATEGGHA
jgi:hypothetical protein